MGDAPVNVTTTLRDIPKKQYRGPVQFLRRLTARIKALMGARPTEDVAEAKDAVAYFLREMEAAAARTYPNWTATLNARMSECMLSFDDHRTVIDRHPIDDYYFAGVVALEAARMRGMYPPSEADEILGEIGE